MVSNDANIVGSQQTNINTKTYVPIEGVRFYPSIVKPEYFLEIETSNK